MIFLANYVIVMGFIGLLLNIPLLIIILKKNLLSQWDGVITGALIIVLIFLFSPILWLGMIFFFFTSSFLSKWKIKEKESTNVEFAKGPQRDAIQVLSNSLPAILFGSMYFINEVIPILSINMSPSTVLVSPWMIASFTAIATHNADTWMTEIGITVKRYPRLITNLKIKVQHGTSGGITLEGTIAGVIGSFSLAVIYFLGIILTKTSLIRFPFEILILITIGGVLGGLIDSLEGATIQGIYYCENCQKETEAKIHKCGNTSKFHRGYILVSNDFVNLSSALLSGIIVGLVYFFLSTF
ncbi:DUF92 domain-containing protein [Candidatus Hodarchaeum mangrovi]